MNLLLKIQYKSRNFIIIFFTAVFSLLLYFLLPQSLTELQCRMITIFFVATVFWATEALPLYATSLLVVGFQILVLSNKGGIAHLLPAFHAYEAKEIPYHIFSDLFGSGIIILFMGGFLLSAALSKHKVDQYLTAKILAPLSHNPHLLLLGVLILSAFFSMWMSNTATATMMIAIVMPIVIRLPQESRFKTGLLLAIPIGANLGGLGTPIGTPPNAIAFEALENLGPTFKISFLKWFLFALPLEIILLTCAYGLLIMQYKPKTEDRIVIESSNEKLSARGILSLIILGIAILLWLSGTYTGIASSSVALLIAAALTAFGILGKRDVDSINWNILLLMWGGLALGEGIKVSELDVVVESFSKVFVENKWVITIVIILIAIIFSTFMSNTATANLMIPICLALPLDSQFHNGQLAIVAAFACSLAMAMPVSTPPNAITYATNHLNKKDFMIAGLQIGVIGCVIILAAYHLFLPKIFS